MVDDKKIKISLLFIRLSVFLVMFMWTVDKFINIDHAKKILENFYNINSFNSILIYGLASVEMIVLVLFVAGYQKKYTYGAVLIFHAISTLFSLKHYFSPFEGVNLLFFAAWPMLAACFTLFILRDKDTFTLGAVSHN